MYLPKYIVCKKKLGQNILVLMAHHMPAIMALSGELSLEEAMDLF